MADSYAYTAIGAITGGDAVIMRADRADLATLAFGSMYNWDGVTWTQVTDVDAPSPATTLAIVARRWVAGFEDNDAWGWSKAGLFNDWDPSGVAVDQDLPDPIVGQEEIGGDLWSFNSRSTQIWQATGGDEAGAFAKVTGINIKVGLAGPNAVAKMGAGVMILGHTRQVFGTDGSGLSPIPNPGLEQALKALSVAELSECLAWSYTDVAKEFWGLNSAALDSAHVFDNETKLWHERKRYGRNGAGYDVDFSATAFGKTFVAGSDSPKVWSLEDDVFYDESDPIVRVMTVHIPSQGTVAVSRLVWDMSTRAVPLEGQGSSPVMRVRTSNDNGDSWSDWRTIDLPTLANKFLIQDFAFGLADPLNGMLIQHEISDPIGFTFNGLWVNPTPQELNGAIAA
jgi:hypothetical protein